MATEYAILARMGRKLTIEEMNRLFASRGGKARAAKLNPARRLEIATKASAAAKAKRETLEGGELPVEPDLDTP